MRALRHLRRFRRDESGTTLVELALVIPVFLLMFFMLLDFGRMSYNWVMAEKAMQMAARMAAVRPPICPGAPTSNLAAPTNTARFGTSCTNGAVCIAADLGPCDANDAGVSTETVNAIWGQVGPLLQGTDSQTGQAASAANLLFTYTYDPEMNFLGGPYVPVVTVEIQNLEFHFVSPLAGLSRLAGATNSAAQQAREQNGVPFPSMSVSLPGEDLALGDAG